MVMTLLILAAALASAQTGPGSPSSQLALSPDHKTLAVVGGDRKLTFWDVDAGTVAALAGAQPAASAAFSHDGRLLAAGNTDSTISVWDTRSRKRKAVLRGHDNEVLAVAFSGDGKLLASGGADDSVRIWDLAHAVELAELKGHTEAVSAVAFLPKGRAASGGSFDRTVRLWDLAAGSCYAVIQASMSVGPVAVSADGGLLAWAGHSSAEVRVWDLAAGQLKWSLKGTAPSIRSLEFSSDGKSLAAAGSDQSRQSWDLATGGELARPARGVSASEAADGRICLYRSAAAGADPVLWKCLGAPAAPAQVEPSSVTAQVERSSGTAPEEVRASSETASVEGESGAAVGPTAAEQGPVEALLKDKDYRGALELLKPLTARFPKDAGLWIAQAMAAFNAGDRALALSSLAQAEGSDPGPRDLRSIAASYRTMEEPAKALAALKAGTLRLPDEPALRIDEAEAEVKAGDLEAARAALAKAEALKASDADRRRIERIYTDIKEYPRAMDLVRGLLKSAPGDPDLWIDQADIAARTGDRAAALDSVEKASKLSPSYKGSRRAIQILINLGAYDRALEVSKGLGGHLPPEADFWTEQAYAAVAAKKADLAREAAARARSLKPEGAVLRRLAEVEESLKEKSSADLWVDEAEHAIGQADKGLAKEAVAKAEALKPGRDGWRRIALVQQYLGRCREARSILKRLAGSEPVSAQLFSDKAVCELSCGSRETAVSDLKKAIELDGSRLQAYLTLGSIYADKGAWSEAVALYDRALEAQKGRGDPLLEKVGQAREQALAKTEKR